MGGQCLTYGAWHHCGINDSCGKALSIENTKAMKSQVSSAIGAKRYCNHKEIMHSGEIRTYKRGHLEIITHCIQSTHLGSS